MMRLHQSLLAALCVVLTGCTVATHDYKHRYWTQKDGMQPLPPADVFAASGYISYPLLFERKKLFSAVSDNCDAHPLDVRVKTTVSNAMSPALALPWILVSGPRRARLHVSGRADGDHRHLDP